MRSLRGPSNAGPHPFRRLTIGKNAAAPACRVWAWRDGSESAPLWPPDRTLPRSTEIKTNEIVKAITKELRDMVKSIKDVLQD